VIPGGQARAIQSAPGLEPDDLREDLADRRLEEPAVPESRGVAAKARGEGGPGGLALIQTGCVARTDEARETIGTEVSLSLSAEPAHRIADAGSHGGHPQRLGGLCNEAARCDQQEQDHAPGAGAHTQTHQHRILLVLGILSSRRESRVNRPTTPFGEAP
jgi:hypothetical protein